VRSRLQEVFARSVGAVLEAGGLSFSQTRVLRRVTTCRTAALGGHLHHCTACGYEQPRYNSCRDRHCPLCQALPQARWIEGRKQRMLPVGHFHVVFTLPGQLRTVALQAPEQVYGLLFRAASTVLQTLAREYLGGQVGLSVVLHTWTRELLVHPHVHCIVTAGALDAEGSRWTPTRRGWLFPVRRMAAFFRNVVLQGVEPLLLGDEVRLPQELSGRRLLRTLRRRKWVVYAKRPLRGPSRTPPLRGLRRCAAKATSGSCLRFKTTAHLVGYLGRYTHRVAISDARVVALDEGGVTFRTRGEQTCRLDDASFIRRFVRHVLPRGFRKIRHYGLYAPSSVRLRLEQARTLLEPQQEESASEEPQREQQDDWRALLLRLAGIDLHRCRRCGARAVVVEPLGRGPPTDLPAASGAAA
jgi:hypothetical protein